MVSSFNYQLSDRARTKGISLGGAGEPDCKMNVELNYIKKWSEKTRMAVSEGSTWFHRPAGAISRRNVGWGRTREQIWGRGLGVSPLMGVGRLCQAPVEDPHAAPGVETGIKSLSLLSSAGFIYAFVLTEEKKKERSAWGRWPGRL